VEGRENVWTEHRHPCPRERVEDVAPEEAVIRSNDLQESYTRVEAHDVHVYAGDEVAVRTYGEAD
jgi:hypothetical protein